VQAFYARKQQEGLSAKSVNNIHGMLHKALDHAVRWGLAPRNVCDAVSLPKRTRHEIQPLDEMQARQLLTAARGHHDLRHSAATILLSMGVPAKVVQEILGHSQISMTMDIYSHVLPVMQQEAMGKMDDLFGRDIVDENRDDDSRGHELSQ